MSKKPEDIDVIQSRLFAPNEAIVGSMPRPIPARLSQNMSVVGSPHRQSTSYVGSMKRKPTLAHSPSLHSRNASQDLDSDEGLTDGEVAAIVSEHLVVENQVPTSSFGSVSHSLLGGEVTRNIYKWKESRDGNRHRRNSEPGLSHSREELESPPLRASDLQEPGMFRRFFLANRARQQGQVTPSFVTRNFIDFLVLYGFYGGDVYPEEEDLLEPDLERLYDERDGYNQPGSLGSTLTRRSTSRLTGPTDEERVSEVSPLLRTPRSSTSNQGASESKAFFMLIKAFVGTGVLFLPKAFYNGGLVFSIVLMIILGYLTLHCMILLVESSRALGGKSIGDIGYHLYGTHFRNLLLGSIAISQMGFCCAYYIFVAQNLRDWLMIVSDCQMIYPDWVFILVQLVLYIPLAWVRQIKHFGITSLIADVFILVGLGYIFVFDLRHIGTFGVQQVAWINLESFSLFVGTAMFAFEGICLMLPIAESMKHPERFSKVLTWCIFSICVVFVIIGTLGYLALGEDVGTNIFMNLPKGPVVNGIQFFYAVAIMFSFPLTIYPAIRITEQGTLDIMIGIFGFSTGKGSLMVKWQKNLYRAGLAAMLGVVAWAGSASLDKVVSLVGCFACIPLSFIYPSLFHYHISPNRWVRAKDLLLVVVGTLAMGYTTYVTLQQWAVGVPELAHDRCHDANGHVANSLFH